MELIKGGGEQTPQDEQTSAKDIVSRQRRDDLGMAISEPLTTHLRALLAGCIYESPLWEPNLDTAICISFPGGFHIKIRDGYLPCSLLCEHPERMADNRKVLDF